MDTYFPDIFPDDNIKASTYNGYTDDGRPFFPIWRGDINFICTFDPELFYRFKAYSGILNLLQIKDREERLKLARACLYYEPEQLP
jgi:hypothetical protein